MLTIQEAVKQLQRFNRVEANPLTIRRWIKQRKLFAVRKAGNWSISELTLSRQIATELEKENHRLQQKHEALQKEHARLLMLLENRSLNVVQQNYEHPKLPVKLDLKDDMPF
jgi:hypothetical protein